MMWTDARCDKLRTMWDEGYSGSQIAAELGAPLTRSAVIGKAHRLHLPPRIERQQSQTRKRPNREPKQMKKLAALVATTFDDSPVTLLELTNQTCRWPVNDDVRNMLYCGRPETENDVGQPYCRCHAKQAYQQR